MYYAIQNLVNDSYLNLSQTGDKSIEIVEMEDIMGATFYSELFNIVNTVKVLMGEQDEEYWEYDKSYESGTLVIVKVEIKVERLV